MSDCFSITSLYNSYLRRSVSSAGLSSQTIEIDNETTIHFWGPKSPPNSKPSLLLIHGFGPSGIFQWRRQIVFFAPHFNLYVPDLVFFGESTTKSSERSEAFQANCVGKLMEKIGVKKYSVIGTSYGGFVAYNMALMLPEIVDKVVIASSGLTMTLKDNEGFLKRANCEKTEDIMLPETASNMRTLLRLSIHRRLYMPDFVLNDVIHKLFAENKKEKMEIFFGLTLGKSDTVNLSPLQQEVLIIWGEYDQIFLVEKAYQLEKILGENNKVKLEIIKNSSHVPQIEQSGQFNNAVQSFLSSF